MLAPRDKLWPAHPLLVEAALDLLGLPAACTPETIVGDFGCGDGPALFAAAARGCRAIGWEIHGERAAQLAAEVTARGLGGSITVVEGNALDARFSGEGDEGSEGGEAVPAPTHVFLYLIARGLRLMLPILRRLASLQPSATLPVVTALYQIEGLTPVEVKKVSTSEVNRTPLYLYSITAAAAGTSAEGGGGAE